jgi:type II secretory ATPase GspE/PulE/Tfp pilus assembly ATPase PilB-like protein
MAGRKRIGDRLLDEGLITGEQLQIALAEQRKSGELLGSILFGLGFISQKDLFKVLSIANDGGGEESARDKYRPELSEEFDYLVRQSSTAFQREGDGGRRELDTALSPLVSLVEKILVEGITRRATDVHVGPDMKGVRVRYRVDGVLHHGMFLPADLLNPIVSRFKIMGQMNIAESRVPQDGGAEFFFRKRKLDLRISSFPVVGGENVVVRILDKSQIRVGLENQGFFDDDVRLISESLKLPHGMILVTGPTGSGKTTTLYSFLSMINTVNRHIVTLEDPVEYQIPLARQAQVNVKAGLTFASGLRSILRQDPDVILVGEVRDTETAELVVRASLTGHLVFSTLHTNDAVSCIARIVDMGIDPFLVSSVLDTVIAQRLVRVLCPECKEEIPRDHPQYQMFGLDAGSSPLYRAQGCPACLNTGFSGRTAIYEILKITPEMAGMINARAGLEELRRHACDHGFRTMMDVGMEKVRMGLTTLEEVGSVTRLVP